MAGFWKTFFPRFTTTEVEEVPDLVECSESSSLDDDSHDRRQEKLQLLDQKYRTKEDEDVAVFMELAQKMPIKSLIFLLQNHVQAQNFPEAYLQAALSEAQKQKQLPTTKRAISKQKQFRFAEVSGGKVRTIVHEIPAYDGDGDDNDKSLWWQKSEFKEIRSDCVSTVSYFRKYRPEFTESIMALTTSAPDSCDTTSDDEKALQRSRDDTIKGLALDAATRGLEVHIVPLLMQLKNKTVNAVMQAQHDKESPEGIRLHSLNASLPARNLAVQMGQSDRVEALKASVARWRRQTPVESERWWE